MRIFTDDMVFCENTYAIRLLKMLGEDPWWKSVLWFYNNKPPQRISVIVANGLSHVWYKDTCRYHADLYWSVSDHFVWAVLHRNATEMIFGVSEMQLPDVLQNAI